MEQCSIAWEGVVECKLRDFIQTARLLQHVFPKSLNQGAEVLTFEQLRYEVSRHRSSHVIIRWPCLLDGWLPKFTANNFTVTLMMSSSDNQPTTTTALLLLKEAPVYSNKVCNDSNETQDHMAGLCLTATLCFTSWQGEKTTQGKVNLFKRSKCKAVSVLMLQLKQFKTETRSLHRV